MSALRKAPLVPCLVALLAALPFPSCAPVRRPADAAELRAADGAAADAALDAKLEAQWQRFDAAQALALEKVAVQKQLLPRADWEAALAPPPELAFTPSDLDALRARHDALVEAAKAKARGASRLDLDKLRAAGAARTREFCRDMPKGGMLHLHPWGTLDRATVKEILTKVDPLITFDKLVASLSDPGGTGAIYPEEKAELEALAASAGNTVKYLSLTEQGRATIENLFFLPPGNHGFDRFTATFTAISALIFGGGYDPEPLMFERFFARAKAHHVRYVEISRNIVPKPQWFNALQAWAKKVEEEHGVVVRLRAAFNRNKEPEYTRGKAEQLLKMPASPILTGIDLLADETSEPAFEKGQTLYLPVLQAVRSGQSQLHRSMHAGELGDPRNVRDALVMGAERIGHGVRLQDDVVTLEYARLKKIPIEINLDSNRRLKVLEDTSKHPFLRYLRLGLPVSLSTDDEGIFESTIDTECELAIGETDITWAELRQLALDAVETAFVDDATRQKLAAAVESDLGAFESAWDQAL